MASSMILMVAKNRTYQRNIPMGFHTMSTCDDTFWIWKSWLGIVTLKVCSTMRLDTVRSRSWQHISLLNWSELAKTAPFQTQKRIFRLNMAVKPKSFSTFVRLETTTWLSRQKSKDWRPWPRLRKKTSWAKMSICSMQSPESSCRTLVILARKFTWSSGTFRIEMSNSPILCKSTTLSNLAESNSRSRKYSSRPLRKNVRWSARWESVESLSGAEKRSFVCKISRKSWLVRNALTQPTCKQFKRFCKRKKFKLLRNTPKKSPRDQLKRRLPMTSSKK